MNSIEKVLQKIADSSNGQMKIVKVPDDRKPTARSLRKLDAEIHAQIEANRAMEHRSFINACKRF